MDVEGLFLALTRALAWATSFLDDLSRRMHWCMCPYSGSVNEKVMTCRAFELRPCNDCVFLEEELDLWYLSIIKRLERFVRMVMQIKGTWQRLSVSSFQD